ncbi:MAG: ANTAR domain-containing response regulator [Brotaphodocola sp.]
MANVIVAFSKPEDAKGIKNILMRNGFQVTAVCNSGAQALARVGELGSGILVCGYRLADMLFSELSACLPPEFQMLLVVSPGRQRVISGQNVVCLSTPLKVHDLVSTLEMMSLAQSRRRKRRKQEPAKRSEEDRELLNQAKRILMERNHMTEDEAHRYIQKCSMDSGTNMIETAQMVISLSEM